MKTIAQTYVIKAPIAKVWQALVDPVTIARWSGGLAEMTDQAGESFSLWGGDISGKNIEVEPKRLLVQEWNDGTFKQPSTVRFELSESEGMTTIELMQSDIPDSRAKDVDAGWREYYMEPIKLLLEQ